MVKHSKLSGNCGGSVGIIERIIERNKITMNGIWVGNRVREKPPLHMNKSKRRRKCNRTKLFGMKGEEYGGFGGKHRTIFRGKYNMELETIDDRECKCEEEDNFADDEHDNHEQHNFEQSDEFPFSAEEYTIEPEKPIDVKKPDGEWFKHKKKKKPHNKRDWAQEMKYNIVRDWFLTKNRHIEQKMSTDEEYASKYMVNSFRVHKPLCSTKFYKEFAEGKAIFFPDGNLVGFKCTEDDTVKVAIFKVAAINCSADFNEVLLGKPFFEEDTTRSIRCGNTMTWRTSNPVDPITSLSSTMNSCSIEEDLDIQIDALKIE